MIDDASNGKEEKWLITLSYFLSKMSFDDGEETVTAGGAAVIVGEGQEPPLVIQTMGERNPDGKVVTTGYFSRILNLNDVQTICVDGTEYPLN